MRCSINDAGLRMTHVDTKAAERFPTTAATLGTSSHHHAGSLAESQTGRHVSSLYLESKGAYLQNQMFKYKKQKCSGKTAADATNTNNPADIHEGVVGVEAFASTDQHHRTIWKLLTVLGHNHAAMQSHHLPTRQCLLHQLTLILTTHTS